MVISGRPSGWTLSGPESRVSAKNAGLEQPPCARETRGLETTVFQERPSRSDRRTTKQWVTKRKCGLKRQHQYLLRESAVMGIIGVRTLGFHIDSALAELRVDRALVLLVGAAAITASADGLSRAIRRRMTVPPMR